MMIWSPFIQKYKDIFNLCYSIFHNIDTLSIVNITYYVVQARGVSRAKVAYAPDNVKLAYSPLFSVLSLGQKIKEEAEHFSASDEIMYAPYKLVSN